MMTKLSRIDSSSSSLKYSVRTCSDRDVSYLRATVKAGAQPHRYEFVEEGEDLGRIRVLLGQSDDCIPHQAGSVEATRKVRSARCGGRTVEVVVADVEVVDALAGEARRDVRAVLLLLEDEWEEALDRARGHVVPVRALDQGLRNERAGQPTSD